MWFTVVFFFFNSRHKYYTMFSHPGSLVLKSTLGAQFLFLPGGGRLHDMDILKNWAHYFIYSLLLLYSACSSVSCRPSSVVGWFFSISSFCFSLPLPVLMVYKDLFLKFSILWSFTLCNIWSIAKKASYQASSCQFSAPLLLEDNKCLDLALAAQIPFGGDDLRHAQLGSGVHTREAGADIWFETALSVSACLLIQSLYSQE